MRRISMLLTVALAISIYLPVMAQVAVTENANHERMLSSADLKSAAKQVRESATNESLNHSTKC
jgi:hypothetical protein